MSIGIQYIEVRDSFAFHPRVLEQRRNRELMNLTNFLIHQFSQEFYTVSRGTCHIGSLDIELQGRFKTIISKNVTRLLPKLLGRNFARRQDELIAHIASVIRKDLTNSIPQLAQFYVQEGGVEQASKPEDSNRTIRILAEPIERDAVDREEVPHEPVVESDEIDNLVLGAAESEIDNTIRDLREKELRLTFSINHQKEHVEELKEILGFEQQQGVFPEKFPRSNGDKGKKRGFQTLSVQEQKELRVKHMQQYIKRRRKELDNLRNESNILEKRLHKDEENFEEGFELRFETNVEDAPNLSSPSVEDQFSDQDTFSYVERGTQPPIAPEILKMIPRVVRLKQKSINKNI